jgi:hypothetical protein
MFSKTSLHGGGGRALGVASSLSRIVDQAIGGFLLQNERMAGGFCKMVQVGWEGINAKVVRQLNLSSCLV